ncbi:MAG: AAA family ATPase [Myxococcota bacterium]
MRRIHVIGTSGTGKSTVGAALAGRLGVPFVELDALHWLPGWTTRPPDELRRLLTDATAGDGWVVDGNYGAWVRELLWPRVDAVVWLDLPRRTALRQVTTRTFGRWWRRELLWGTNRESLRMSLLSRESILWWTWSTHARRRAGYAVLLADPPFEVIRLRTRAEVDRWLASVPSR